MTSTSHNSCRENIKVVCRLRPENVLEKNSGQKVCITHTTNTLKIAVDHSSEKRGTDEETYDFAFDQVFGSESRQSDVFNTVAKPMIDKALEGWNGTLFCYGQTSSGKTHTMEGRHNDTEQRGIIPNMMEYVFDLINKASNDIEFTVKCSSLEVYNERIQDLLDPRKNNLMIKEEKTKGIWVEDATEVYVMNKEEMRDVFKCGSENRKIGATAMNDKSSRSHSIFIVTIFQKDSKTDSTKTGKLYFIDLAGSEKLSKTKIEGGTLLEEAKNINKSLLMLGMVINALTEGKPHIPYRDSKLTRILQESLGGNSHTTLVITCSMSAFNDRESLSTLRFGQRAKAIKNKLTANTERSAKELLLKLIEAEDKIKYYQDLISKIQKGEGTIFQTVVDTDPVLEKHATNPYNTYKKNKCDDCSTAMRKLLDQHIEVVTMQEELEKIRHDKMELEEEILARNGEIYEMNEKVLLSELKTKLFIEDELNSFQQLQMKLESIFLGNQNKLLQTSKLKNILEITRYEIIIRIKANKLKLDKSEQFAVNGNEEISTYEKNLEESLDILNRIEEYIITDNKSFNEIVDLIAGKNSENDYKVSEFNHQGIASYQHPNNNPNTTINNINLNINKNININIFNKDKKIKHKRRNSFSYNKKKSLHLNRGQYTKSCVPAYFNKESNYNTMRHSINLYSQSNLRKQPSYHSTQSLGLDVNEAPGDSLIIHSNQSFDLENQIESILDNPSEKIDVNTILKSQRKTICNLAFEYKNLKDVLSHKNKEFYEKEIIINKNSENILKSENQIKDYEYVIENLKNQLKEKDNLFEVYKVKTMKDFEYKEKKIVDLINKVNDLEDENYKMVHFNKDKDKKKFYLMEKQIKEFALEMQKLISQNSQLKNTIYTNDEEIKSLNSRIIEFQNRPVDQIRNKMNEISFCGNNLQDMNSGTCTPGTSNFNPNTGFRYATLNDILAAKLKNYNSVSPYSNANGDKRSSENSSGEPNRMMSSLALQMAAVKNSYNNLRNNKNNNIPSVITPNSGSLSSQNLSSNYKQPNMMKIIRGGNSNNNINKTNNNNNNNNFFNSKMLSSGGDHGIKYRKKKNEEMKIYEKDEINNSEGSDVIKIKKDTDKINSSRKEKGGIFGFFSKLIHK